MRTALRAAVATALLAGLAVTPVLATGTAFAADGPAATAENGTLVRTETLYNGTVVKIYKLGPTWYRAESFKNGQSIGSVEANARAAAGNDNGNYLVLFEDGRTLAWRGNVVSPAELGLYRLADGTVVELGKNPKDGRFGLQPVDKTGQGGGFVYAYHPVRSVWTYGKAVVVLENDGGLAAYVPGQAEQAAPVHLGAGVNPKPAPKPGTVLSGPTANGCTVTEKIASVFPYWTVTLTNDLKKGPEAVLRDDAGKVVGTADRQHPVDGRYGLKIEGADTAAPKLGQRTQGGDMPYRWVDFPKLPQDCSSTTPTATPTPAPTSGSGGNGGQTTVVPKGGVAAGAEFGSVEHANDTALLASAGGAAAVVAAGLGFTALRRRTAADRG
ncbi:hypothetical protein ACFY8W_09255 [Streptomyces sp. NPDC012637]|uniref:hypothetical protein n=1 Tax=Streptomyces sp. NPDC012637 TaxID=3364842 RepID=UPI0036E72973